MTKATYALAPRATLAMGAAGAIVGGSIAAARNYDRVKKSQITREEAVKDVIKETGGAGLATATATALVSAMGVTGLLSLASMVVFTAGAKYMADKFLDARTACGQAAPKPQEAVEEAPKKKKTKTAAAK